MIQRSAVTPISKTPDMVAGFNNEVDPVFLDTGLGDNT